MTRAELRRKLEKAEAEAEKLTKAIRRANRFSGWAKRVGLKRLSRWLERRAKDLIERREGVRERVRSLERRLKNWSDVPGIDGGWHPGAERNQVSGGIGDYLSVPAKLVWHTTEGSSLPTYSGSAPHFTLDPRTGKLWQHVPIHSGAMALQNDPGGVETNRAHAIQVELIGFAAATEDWPADYYDRIAELARWIEKHAGVERRCAVTFRRGTAHLTGSTWLAYRGHLGHQHVPENDHWDPGAFRIEEVI